MIGDLVNLKVYLGEPKFCSPLEPDSSIVSSSPPCLSSDLVLKLGRVTDFAAENTVIGAAPWRVRGDRYHYTVRRVMSAWTVELQNAAYKK